MESVLFEDNPHWTNKHVYDHYTSRELLPKALSYLDTKQIIALIGARRVGKSTIAKLMIKELLKSTEAKNIFFINLEKPEFIPFKNDPSYLNKIYDEYLKLADPNKDEKIYFFMDEVQIFQNWEIFVKSKYENSAIKFIITGSNSSLLTSNYATVLTGRVLKLQVYSFSFAEFLNYKEIAHQTTMEQIANKIEIARAKDEYLKWGGYYNVISVNDAMIKKETLKNIAEDIILKDIVPRYNIKNSSAIKDLFYYVVSNAASTLNYTKLAKKINIDAKSIKEYIGYFEDNFLLTTISNYHTKLTEQIKSAKKVYLNDNGFLNLGINRSLNNGIRLENWFFNILNRRDENLTYLKENKEVDFYSQNRLYQVTYTMENEETRKREIEAFYHFSSLSKNYCLITFDRQEEIEGIDVATIDTYLFSEKIKNDN